MRMSWGYIAGFFDGEGSVSTVNYSLRGGISGTIVTISQSGTEGLRVLTAIQEFCRAAGIKGYVHGQVRRQPYRQMFHFKITARPSVENFLRQMLPLVSVKKVVVQDTLRFYTIYPSIRGPVNVARCRNTGKYGSVVLDREELVRDLAELKTKTAVAKKHGVNVYTVMKYLDPDYRIKYDQYRKRWRAKKVAATRAASAA